jgi:hypothetical protein
MRVTASKVGLLGFCAWWANPEATWQWSTSSAAERGTRFHKAISLYVIYRERMAVEDDIAAEYEQACRWIDALGISKESMLLLTEVAFAWDPATDAAENIGQETDRDYSRGKGRLCGTADLVLLVKMDGRIVGVMVWDFKTGDGSGAGPQLRTLGLMAARVWGVESVTVAALEVRASGVTEVAREELDAFALAGIAGELAEQIAAIESAEPQPGSHCGELYCPARLSCPLGTAATAEVAAIVPVESLTKKYRITDPIKTADQAIWALDVLRLMGAWLDAKKDEIKALVPAEGWATEDGRVLKETRATIEAFDKHKAQALLKELGATDEQIGGCFYTFEKSNGLRVSGGATKPRTKRSKAA